MESSVTRRDFLKYSVAAGAVMATSGGVVADPGARPTSGFVEVDKLTIWTIADNYYDALRPDTKVARRYRSTPGKSVHAEWGLSFFVETVVDGKTSACMFDYGLDPGGVTNNMALLGLDIGKAKAFALSHGHYDHYTSAATLFAQAKSRIAPGTPFFVGEEAFARRYSLRPGSADPVDIGALRREDIEGAGLKVVEVKAPTQVIPGAYLTGPIERVTAYEKGSPGSLVKRGDKLERDSFPGEQGMFFLVRGKGLVVISGCAHAGIVNTVLQARKTVGDVHLHAVIGGTHLANAKPELIQSTVGDVKALKPDLVVPAHCTGFEAVVAMSREMPNEFLVNTAGTQFTFAA